MAKSKINIQVLDRPGQADLRRLTARRGGVEPRVEAVARRILAEVREHGDAAVAEYTRRYDGCTPEPVSVPETVIRNAGHALGTELKAAIASARVNIRRFHEYHREDNVQRIHTQPGVECFQRLVPLDRVGLYVPGGRHPLFSSLLMLGVPALLAGCRDVVVCTPPDRQGNVHPAILYCADLLGLRRILRVGGAQAVAAMAYGTRAVPRVDKIFGPGNGFVTAAKMLVARDGVAIDMPAGPSELMVVADGTARADFVAADLLGQLEHGAGSRAVLVSLDKDLAAKVRETILKRAAAGEFSATLLENLKHTVLLVVENRQQALHMVNDYAPEHLSLAVKTPENWVEGVRHAGSVFLGHWAPEAAGDYASGTNHTLPTGGYARAWSGITVRSFQKSISFQRLTPAGLLGLAASVETMAAAEKLPLHAASVAVRRRAAQALPRQLADPRELLSQRARLMQPYICAGEQSRFAGSVLLDANEMPVPLPGAAGLNRYPDPRQRELTRRIADIYGWAPETILLGNGSDELIDILVRGFCDPRGDRVLVTPPTYGMYAVSARANGVEVVEVPLGQRFGLDVEAVVDCAREYNARLVFLCSPNNPTGNLLKRGALLEVVRRSGAAVVVDEAYIDFSGDPGLVERINEHANLLVMRTFSKSWAAAGVRLGVLIGHPVVLDVLRGLQAPYNISTPNQEAMMCILDRLEERNILVHQLVEQRQELARRLSSLDCVVRVYPSRANFLLVRFAGCGQVWAWLADCGIRVRDRSGMPGCTDCLRISVGTAAENQLLLDCLKRYAGGNR